MGAFGSLSLPFAGSDDAMVKVASETLTDELFYDRFFALLDRFLEGQGGEEPEAPSVAPEAPRPAAPLNPAAPATTFPVKPVPNPG